MFRVRGTICVDGAERQQTEASAAHHNSTVKQSLIGGRWHIVGALVYVCCSQKIVSADSSGALSSRHWCSWVACDTVHVGPRARNGPEHRSGLSNKLTSVSSFRFVKIQFFVERLYSLWIAPMFLTSVPFRKIFHFEHWSVHYDKTIN